MTVGGSISRALIAGIVAATLTCAVPGPAAATTVHVSPGGSATASGSADDPFDTIGRGAQAAGAGDTIEVSSGVYPETVTVPRGARDLTFRGVGPTMPVIEGGGGRRFGFVADSPSRVRIEGFELRGQTEAGIYLVRSAGATVAANLLHHIGTAASEYGTGVKLSFGSGARVAQNTVHSIGPGGQAIGIWLLQTRGAVVADNTVYLVRKEGIRDWQGLDNRITDNRAFLNWAGLSLNTSSGSIVANNYAYDNAIGIVAKHVSHRKVLEHWDLAEAHPSSIHTNTVWRSTGVSLALGQSGEPFDYVDVRNNIFEDAGLAYIHDMPDLRGPHVTVDGNAFAPPANGRPEFIYKSGWRENEGGIATFAAYRNALGWDQNGDVLDPELIDPAGGNLDYTDTSPAASAGTPLPDGSGAQLGARGLVPAAATWTPYRMTPMDSSSSDSWWTRVHLDDTSDDNQFSYWLSNTDQNEFVTYDFGQPRTFDHLILTVFSHLDERNIRGYRFEVSDDLQEWQTILEGANPDSLGSSYKYELPAPASGRYLRFTMVDSFCGWLALPAQCRPYFVFSDLRAGSLDLDPPVNTSPPPAPEQPPGDPQPAEPDPPPAAGPPQRPPLRLELEVRRQTAAGVARKRALAVSARCGRDCRLVPRVTGRARRALARGPARLEAGRWESLRLRLTKTGKRRLSHADTANLKLVARATAEDGATAEQATTFRLAR